MSATLNEDGTYDQALVYRTGKNKGEAKFDSLDSTLGKVKSVLYKQRTEQVEVPANVQRIVYRANNTLSDEGLYDATFTATISEEDKLGWQSQNNKLIRESTALYRNKTAKLASPTAVNGLYRISSVLNDDATYDQTLVYRTGNGEQKEKWLSRTSTLGRNKSVLYRNRKNALDATTSVQGAVYQTSNNLTDIGLYDTSLVATTSKKQDIEWGSARTPFEQERSQLYRNLRSILTLPGVEQGTYSISARLNDDATYDQTLVYRTGDGSGKRDFLARTLYDNTRKSVIYKSRTDHLEAPSAVQRYVYNATNSFTESGLYDSVLTVEKSKDVPIEFESQKTKFKTAYAQINLNKLTPTVLPSIETGLYQHDVRFNQDGTYNESITYVTGNSDSQARYDSSRSLLQTVDTLLYRESKDKIEPPASAETGVIYRTSNSLTSDGLYSGQLDLIKSKQSKIDWSSSDNFLGKSKSFVYTNYKDEPADPVWSLSTQGVVYKTDKSINADGTYDTRIDVVNAKQDVNASLYFQDLSGFIRINKFFGITDPQSKIDGLPDTDEYRTTVEWKIRDDGLYDITITQRKNAWKIVSNEEIEFIRPTVDLYKYEHVNNGVGSTGVQVRAKMFRYNVKGQEKYSEALDEIENALPGSYIDRKGGMFISWRVKGVYTTKWKDDEGDQALSKAFFDS